MNLEKLIQQVKTILLDYPTMDKSAENPESKVFHPIIFNFNYPFHMNDYELNHLLKFLQEEFESKLTKMRFVFVFKV
jgi:hypothetical protein